MDFVPLGIPAFDGSIERSSIKFTLEISDNHAHKMLVQVRDGANAFYEETITDPAKLKKGAHAWYWDGFDTNGVLDTAFLTTARLNLLTKVWYHGDTEFTTLNFKATYDEVPWVDVKIHKNTQRIDVTLRVNLQDGGAHGFECENIIEVLPPAIKKECAWDKIPKKSLIAGTPPIKTRTKSFKDLETLAIAGLNYHWGRNTNHFVAKHVDINGTLYEVFVNAVKSKINALKSPEIKYITNSTPGRSRNWELSRVLYYNEGYLDFSDWYNIEGDWKWRNSSLAMNLFKETAAHEIGHEILLAYGGHDYSKKHKETSTLLQKENAGLKYPKTEIDLMKYYDEAYLPNFKKIAASETDTLSLLWLTKLKLQ